MMEDRFLKRLRKKARKGLRGWPIATVAFYGPKATFQGKCPNGREVPIATECSAAKARLYFVTA